MDLPDHKKIVGQNIKDLRKKNGMSAKILALELGISASAVSQMENGKVDFTLSILHKLAGIFNVDIACLITSKTIHSTRELKNLNVPERTILIETIVVEQLLTKVYDLNYIVEKMKSEK